MPTMNERAWDPFSPAVAFPAARVRRAKAKAPKERAPKEKAARSALADTTIPPAVDDRQEDDLAAALAALDAVKQ